MSEKNNESTFNLKITMNDILLVVLIGVTYLTYSTSKDMLNLEREKFTADIVKHEYFPERLIEEAVETAYIIENEGEKRGGYELYVTSNDFWLERDEDGKGRQREVKFEYTIGKNETDRLAFKVYMPTNTQLPAIASYRIILVTNNKGVIHNRQYCYQLVESKMYKSVGCPPS